MASFMLYGEVILKTDSFSFCPYLEYAGVEKKIIEKIKEKMIE